MKPLFVRFGGLSLVRQKGYVATATSFHSPPARRGVYAFPIKAIELFLLGGGFGNKSWAEKLGGQSRRFTHSGMVWHHLGAHCPPSEVIARKGDWVKTTIPCWQKAFSKESLQNRYVAFHPLWGRITAINEPYRAGIAGIMSKDHYEVFFDEKLG